MPDSEKEDFHYGLFSRFPKLTLHLLQTGVVLTRIESDSSFLTSLLG